MTPDLLTILKAFRAARKGRMINISFLDDGGVQVSAQNGNSSSWSCGMGDGENALEDAFWKALGPTPGMAVEEYADMIQAVADAGLAPKAEPKKPARRKAPKPEPTDDEDDYSNLI